MSSQRTPGGTSRKHPCDNNQISLTMEVESNHEVLNENEKTLMFIRNYSHLFKLEITSLSGVSRFKIIRCSPKDKGGISCRRPWWRIPRLE